MLLIVYTILIMEFEHFRGFLP